MPKFPIAFQPYTIQKQLVEDYAGSLERVAAIGYQGIEIGMPPEGMKIAEQKALLDRLGLQVINTWGGFNSFDIDTEQIADYLDEVGGRYITVSMLFDGTLEDVLNKSGQMNRIGEAFHRRGKQFLYHNHDWEFKRIDGETILDILLRETDPELVKMEMDTYWIKRGGEDPAVYLSKLQNRCPLLHIKDMEAGEEQFFAEIGEGILDFTKISRVAEAIGTQWLVVEQDQSRLDPFESLAISYRNLHHLDLIIDNNK
ncbi:sugar phosphate isomerase/epimerase [Paenibacillus frigoriresistens]|uniref:sugar phosphate isomerase/epimerase family protein n=1 Tax=Paenibacillus alginolyticus TaxID=59839 RepID=UPI001566CC6E|nr:sugar phosphate isomerase/epimerase [Paenibacillus frigoriresistens]NRF95310.1 sugar phosphate isomerase/epimerase [Paenibacillus frigoriresistens]